jgi:hypothetical protein
LINEYIPIQASGSVNEVEVVMGVK